MMAKAWVPCRWFDGGLLAPAAENAKTGEPCPEEQDGRRLRCWGQRVYRATDLRAETGGSVNVKRDELQSVGSGLEAGDD